jgi:hypothetical protein
MNSYNITGYQGSTLLLTLTCTNSDGTYLNLNGYNVRGGVKGEFSSTGLLLNLYPSIISFESGKIRISGNSNDLAGTPIGIFPYDIEAYNSGDYVFKPLRGYLYCFPESYNL